MTEASVVALPTLALQLLALLLLLASAVAVLLQRTPIPYTVGLVVAGLALSALGLVAPTTLSPDLVLEVLLPPLLFEAAFALRWEHLGRVAGPVVVLATLGVVATAAVVGGIMVGVAHLPPVIAILFGVLVAATDPVAVIAFFRTSRAAPDLRALVEGESLLNDGTAVVLVGVVAIFAQSGNLDSAAAVLAFLRIAVGGLLVGGLIGLAGSFLAHGTSDYLVEATISVSLAYGAYLLGVSLQVSGVLAVVAAGSVFGNFGRRFGISRRTEATVDVLWSFLAFVANSVVFLLLGIAVVPRDLLAIGPLAAIGVIAAWFGRAVVAYGFGFVLARLGAVVPLAYRHVLFWGGLRGALPVVVALSIAPDVAAPKLFQDLVLGVVVVSLLIQGITLRPVLQKVLKPRGATR